MAASAAALLPGHVAAAEVAAEAEAMKAAAAVAADNNTLASGAAAAAAPDSDSAVFSLAHVAASNPQPAVAERQRRVSAGRPRAPQFVPIVPLEQAKAAAAQPRATGSPKPRAGPAAGRGRRQAATQRPERATGAPAEHADVGAEADAEVGAAEADAEVGAAAVALAEAVSDVMTAGAVEWSDEQVAALLQWAAQLSHYIPELRGPSASPVPSASGAAGQGGHSSSEAESALRRQLRFRLQQLLLRLDGLLPGSGQEASLSRRRSRRSRHSAQQEPPQLSVAAAAAAAWAAAALHLRLSPDGAVHRRLLNAFKQQHAERGGARRSGAGDVNGGSSGLGDGSSAGSHSTACTATEGAAEAETAAVTTAGGQRSGSDSCMLQLHRMAAVDLSRMLWALARLDLRVPSVWLDGIVRVLLEAPACIEEPLLPSLPSPHSGPSSVQSWSRRADAAAAFAKTAGTGSTTHPGAAAAKGLQALPAPEIARVSWAVVQLSATATRGGSTTAAAAGGVAGQAAGGVTRKWAQALFGTTQTRMHEFSSEQLVALLWAVGRGRREPNAAWRVAATQALGVAAPQLAPWQVARVTVAMASLRVALPYDLVLALLAALHSRLGAASAGDVAGFVWGLRFVSVPYSRTLARMQMRPLLDLAAATQPALAGLPAGQLVQLADGFAHLGLLPGTEWMKLHREACIRQKSQFDEANRRKVRQAYALMWTL
ncbi:hypothetical protein HYH02_009535 [Chlamydomonas schloesseri]|uniref:Uncharacterized protein n=1 Tax=Chlamydomonas schloesseri TaxID=2026947 RepID=A0A835TCU1_9CHLO|nr:hypothetical protein HYH02_009535 [Chlamydomonas schloesseri]|eukprot:KAG2443122.1 hypothetical protein HYH02_009535 [Chlamydomonas schloesseri]